MATAVSETDAWPEATVWVMPTWVAPSKNETVPAAAVAVVEGVPLLTVALRATEVPVALAVREVVVGVAMTGADQFPLSWLRVIEKYGELALAVKFVIVALAKQYTRNSKLPSARPAAESGRLLT